MADFSDDYYNEVDNAFSDLRRHPFKEDEPVDQTVPQERGVPLSPAGWVENADSTGGTTVRVDADGLHVEAGTVGDGSGTTIDTDGILVEDASLTERVRLGLLSAGTYGLRVSNASGTVIIDGSSQMFKILATGTLTVTASAPSAGNRTTATSDTTLSGLGTFSLPPAHVSVITSSSSVSEGRQIGSSTIEPIVPFFASLSSGGSPNIQFMPKYAEGTMLTYLNGSNECVARIYGANYNTGNSYQWDGRYHVLSEASI